MISQPAPEGNGFSGGDAAGQVFLIGLGREFRRGKFVCGKNVAQGQFAYAFHMGGIGDDAVHAGFKGQRHGFLTEGDAFEIDLGHDV